MAEIKQKILTDEIKQDEILEDPSDPFGLGGEVGAVTNVTNITNTIGSLPSYVASTVTANPGGADKQVQFNDGGLTFGTDTDFTWDKTTNTLNIGASDIGIINSDIELQLTTTDATGADIVLDSGTGTTSNGAGGDVLLQAGTGGSSNGNGGNISLTAGNKSGTGAGGNISLTAKSGGGTNNGGEVEIIIGEDSGGQNSAALKLGSSGNPGQNTRYFLEVSTTDAAATTLFTHSPLTSSLNYYELRVRALRTGGTAGSAQDSAAYVVRAAYKRVGSAAPTIVGAITAEYTAEDQAGWDCTFAVSGNNVLVQVTGALDNNVSWRGELKIIK